MCECLGILRLGFAKCPEQSSESREKKQKSSRDLNANLPHTGEYHNFGTPVVFRHIYLDLYLSLELCWSDRTRTPQSCWYGFKSLQHDPLLQIHGDTPEQTQGRDRYPAESTEKREDFSPTLKDEVSLNSPLILSRRLMTGCGRLAVTGNCKDQSFLLQSGLPNHLGEASNSFIITHHMWDTVCVSWTSVLREMQIIKCQSYSVLLWLTSLDLAAVMSILAALMLWSSSVDPPPAGPSMCMKNQVTPLTCAPITWMVAAIHSQSEGAVFWGWAADNPLLGLLA